MKRFCLSSPYRFVRNQHHIRVAAAALSILTLILFNVEVLVERAVALSMEVSHAPMSKRVLLFPRILNRESERGMKTSGAQTTKERSSSLSSKRISIGHAPRVYKYKVRQYLRLPQAFK